MTREQKEPHARVPREVWTRIQKLAQKHDRSASKELVHALRVYLEQHEENAVAEGKN